MSLSETEVKVFGDQNPERFANRPMGPIEASRVQVLADAESVLEAYLHQNPALNWGQEKINTEISAMERYFTPSTEAAPKESTQISTQQNTAPDNSHETTEKFDLSGVDTALSSDDTRRWLAELQSA